MVVSTGVLKVSTQFANTPGNTPAKSGRVGTDASERAGDKADEISKASVEQIGLGLELLSTI